MVKLVEFMLQHYWHQIYNKPNMQVFQICTAIQSHFCAPSCSSICLWICHLAELNCLWIVMYMAYHYKHIIFIYLYIHTEIYHDVDSSVIFFLLEIVLRRYIF